MFKAASGSKASQCIVQMHAINKLSFLGSSSRLAMFDIYLILYNTDFMEEEGAMLKRRKPQD